MTERQANSRSPTEEEVAAAIALVLSGRLSPPDPEAAVAFALSTLPALAALPSAPGGRVSREAASLVLRDLPRRAGPGGALLAAHRDNLLYRAWYGVNAAKRVAASVLDGEGPVGERLRKALSAESPYFAAHKRASGKRTAGARLNDAAAERFGPILGWNHGSHGPNDRPHHVAANGLNFDVRNPPKETEGLPATLTHCGCVPGPPRRGARMLR